MSIGMAATTVASTTTAVFQLRAPSAWKRAAIKDALRRTHLATEAALAAILADVDRIAALPKKNERTGAMQALAYAALRPWRLSGAGAASARVDAIGMAEGYIATLKDGRASAGHPTIPPMSGRQILYEAAIDGLAAAPETHEAEGLLRDEMSRMARPDKPRPMSLHGYGHFFKLLRHPETGRLFAWVNLLTSDSRFNRGQTEANRRAADADGDMIDIATGELTRCKRPTWVLFPLAFGADYHGRRFMAGGTPGGGRLVYRPAEETGGEERFELHVSFVHEAPAVDTSDRFMGVDRGINKLAAWAVVDRAGHLHANGEVCGDQLRHVQRTLERDKRERQRRGLVAKGRQRRAQADEAVHVAANALVAAAMEHGARVVIEELGGLQRRTNAVPKGDRGGRGGRNLRRVLGRQQYAKLVHVLGYKLPRAGIAVERDGEPLKVGAAYTSITCFACSHRDKANRPRPGDPFLCIACGHADDGDRNAGAVIGLKGAWLIDLPTRRARGGRDLTEDEKFPSFLADVVRRRRNGGPAAEAGYPSAHTFVTPDLGDGRTADLASGLAPPGSNPRGHEEPACEGGTALRATGGHGVGRDRETPRQLSLDLEAIRDADGTPG